MPSRIHSGLDRGGNGLEKGMFEANKRVNLWYALPHEVVCFPLWGIFKKRMMGVSFTEYP